MIYQLFFNSSRFSSQFRVLTQEIAILRQQLEALQERHSSNDDAED